MPVETPPEPTVQSVWRGPGTAPGSSGAPTPPAPPPQPEKKPRNRDVKRENGVGPRMKEERERLGFSGAKFGIILGVNQSTQSITETCGRNVMDDELIAAHAAGADVLYILTGARAGEPQIREVPAEAPPPDLDTLRELITRVLTGTGRMVAPMDHKEVADVIVAIYDRTMAGGGSDDKMYQLVMKLLGIPE